MSFTIVLHNMTTNTHSLKKYKGWAPFLTNYGQFRLFSYSHYSLL